MKKYLLVFVAGLALMLFTGLTVSAQALSSAPKDFQAFFTKFRSAVKRSAKTEVAGMARFPFTYGYDAGDEGKYDKAQFIKNFKSMFGQIPSEYFEDIDLTFHREGRDYTVSTSDATHLGFQKVGTTFKFTSFVVEP